MSSAQFAAIASANRGDNWITGDSSGSYFNGSIVEDSSGNIYRLVSYSGVLTKLDSTGKVLWEKTLGASDEFRRMLILSDGSLILGGYLRTTYDQASLAKLDSSGNFVWHKRYLIGLEVVTFSPYIVSDASGSNLYMSLTRINNGGDPNTDPYYGTISKVNSSDGSITWTRELAQPNGYRCYTSSIALDSSGNVYAVGYYKIDGAGNSGNSWRGYLAKFNSSGTIQWQKEITRTAVGDYTDYLFMDSVSVDSSNNVYVTGEYRFADTPQFGTEAYYARFNTSGTLLDHKAIRADAALTQNFPSDWTYVNAYAYGSNCYVVMYGYPDSSVTSSRLMYIVKFSGSTILYSRLVAVGTATPPSSNLIIDDLTIASTGKMLLYGSRYSPFPTENFIASLPNDGTETGNYASRNMIISYRTESFITGTPPVTVGSGVLTERSATESYTVTTVSSSSSTASYEHYTKRF